MVTREEAVERMERAINNALGGGFRPGSFTLEAQAALDALLDYLGEVDERLIQELKEAADG